MKATEQYFPVVLFIMLYKVVLTFESVVEILKCGNQMNVIAHRFLVKLFILAVQGSSDGLSLYNEILKCDHLKSY